MGTTNEHDTTPRRSTADLALENAMFEILQHESRIADLEIDNEALSATLREALALLYRQNVRVDRQTETIRRLHQALGDARGEIGRAA